MKNAHLTQYPAWRLWPIHLVAKLFGVLVKVDAMPYGSLRIWRKRQTHCNGSGGVSNEIKVAIHSPASLNVFITRAILHWVIENQIPMTDEQAICAADAACKAIQASGPYATVAATPEAAFCSSTFKKVS